VTVCRPQKKVYTIRSKGYGLLSSSQNLAGQRSRGLKFRFRMVLRSRFQKIRSRQDRRNSLAGPDNGQEFERHENVHVPVSGFRSFTYPNVTDVTEDGSNTDVLVAVRR
jgi:hypothetical protein